MRVQVGLEDLGNPAVFLLDSTEGKLESASKQVVPKLLQRIHHGQTFSLDDAVLAL